MIAAQRTALSLRCSPLTPKNLFPSLSRRKLVSIAGRKKVTAVKEAGKTEQEKQPDVDETTRKFGLEAGLWKVFTTKDADGKSKGDQAKELLKRYGSAYLLTSISFAIVSFAACYALVNAGVDVAGLLSRVGLQVTETSEQVGTLALAYAAHKALSPVRFPPTVALTPIVAMWLGKSRDSEASSDA
jgi:hypothetical protein